MSKKPAMLTYTITGLMVIIVGAVLIYQIEKIGIVCEQYESVKFRYESVGLFGNLKKIETHGDNYDGYMDVCVKGKTPIFFKEWQRQ